MDTFLLKHRHRKDQHVSLNIVEEFEQAIQFQSDWKTISSLHNYIVRILRVLFFRIPILKNCYYNSKHQKKYFAVIMGIWEVHRSTPWFLFNNRSNAIYLFDAWEQHFNLIFEKTKELNIDTIFFSAKLSAEYFEKHFPQIKSYWIPEGILAENYRYVNYTDKDIDVLEIGRKYDNYHLSIKDILSKKGYKHLYEKNKGEIIFASDDQFIDGLARAKISVCFPSNVTHPERSGSVSTMTQRYLQSMVSKNLIVGSIPGDMEELFSYNPIIQANLNNPAEQLLDILNHFQEYIPLIEKNYQTVYEYHQWKHRLKDIEKYWT